MNSLAIALDPSSGKHLYEQIYEYIKREIREGKLLYQEKLPSTRVLAEYLEISRSTVDLAYGQLLSEGYIESRPYRGYYVCKVEELYDLQAGEGGQAAVYAEAAEECGIDFSPNAVDMEAFPFDTWRKITKGVLQDDNKELFLPGPPQGDRALREAVGRYLYASRGVNCMPEQIIVGAGNDYLLMLLRNLLGEGRAIAIESPTYKRAYLNFHSFGYQVKTVSMDRNGMDIPELMRSGAQLAYVMPSHQYPTGIVMPIGRRMELLKWAASAAGRYLIEDDYDSEFRYRGKPIPSLQASDKSGRVIYIGTFSKSVAPSIRISYMVLPMALLKLYRERCEFLSCTVSRIDQAVLYTFLKDGYYERHLNKMRKIYRAKHDLMLQQLKPFAPMYIMKGENAGLHLLLESRNVNREPEAAEKDLIARARKAGVRIYGLRETLVGGDAKQNNPTLILGYAGLTEAQIKDGIKRLKDAIFK